MRKEHECCEPFLNAQASGSDSEGFSRLILEHLDGKYTMGSGLPRIEFCPWCGASLPEPERTP